MTIDLWHNNEEIPEESVCIGTYDTLEEALRAATFYWRDVDAGAWLQTQPSDESEDGQDVPHSRKPTDQDYL